MMWMRKSFSIRESRQKEADGDEGEGSASREEEVCYRGQECFPKELQAPDLMRNVNTP